MQLVRRARPVIACLLALASVFAVQLTAAAPASAAPERYVVVLRDGTSPSIAARRHGAAPAHTYRHALRGYAAVLSTAMLARVRRDPAVLLVSRDRAVSLGKPGGGKPGGGGGTTTLPAQSVPTGIRRIDQADGRMNGQPDEGIDVDVAVIDTGIDVAHPDLDVVGGRNCSSGGSYNDGNGHGTHVAGTIAARDDAYGVVGVAPGARLHAARVLNNQGSGSWSSVICGLDWVAAQAGTIEVANLSLGGPGSEDGGCATTRDALHVAVCGVTDAGITVVVAAGNDASDASAFTPAAYDEVITVSAWADFDGLPGGLFGESACRADVDDTFASFSNYGADVDIAAPGVCIHSTWKGGGYDTISGTSMAAPHVAGAAALYRSRYPLASAETTRAAVLAAKTVPAVADDPDGSFEGLLSIAGW